MDTTLVTPERSAASARKPIWPVDQDRLGAKKHTG